MTTPSREDTILMNLINNLKIGNEKDKLYAIGELEEMRKEKSIPALVETLTDLNKTLRTKAEELLAQINPEWRQLESIKLAIPYLMGKLSSRSKDVERAATRWLSELHSTSLPYLIQQLEEATEDEIKWKIAQIIAQIPGDTQSAVPALIQSLQTENMTVKERTIVALKKTKSQEPAVMEALVSCLEDTNSTIRRASVSALQTFERQLAPHSYELVKRLLDNDPKVRDAAALTITAMGEPAIPDLEKLIEERQDLRKLELVRLRKSKGELFKGVNWDAFMMEPYLASRNVNWHVKDIMDELNKVEAGIIHALEILTKLRTKSIGGKSILEEALSDPNPDIHKATIMAIGATSQEEAEETLPILFTLFQKEDDYELIVKSLNEVETSWANREEAQPFLEHLITCLGGDQESKLRAIIAIKAMNEHALQVLMEGLKNDDRVIREEVLKLLIILGEHAKDAIPLLTAISQNDDHKFVREAAQSAIKQIGFKR